MTLRMLLRVAFLAAQAWPALAQDKGSPGDREACQADVFRLCADAIPDEVGIVACLNRRKAALSPACHQVIDPPTRRRGRRTRVTELGPA